MNQDQNISKLFDATEYRKLVELAYLGEWLVNAHHESDAQDEEAAAILQKVLAARKLAGISQDLETGNQYIESEWTDRLFDQYISDYDDHVFWDELSERLAQRDLARTRGVAIDEIDREEDLASLRPIEDTYRRELERDGVERLEFRDSY